MRNLKEIVLSMEEVEAVRLSNLQGLTHEQAAAKMKTSRSTFQRIISAADKKVAEALINGYALRINKA